MYIDGACHPPADMMKNDSHPDNLSAGDILTEDLEGCNVPILIEHKGPPVGTVLATYRGRDKSLRMFGQLNDKNAIDRVNSGELNGLSIGSILQIRHENDKKSVRSRKCNEISICKDPRREGCLIDKINGQRIRQEIWTASKKETNNTSLGKRSSTYVKTKNSL